MNILYVSALGGGLDTSVRVLGPALARAGHRVGVLYLHFHGTPITPIQIEGCEVFQSTIGRYHYYFARLLKHLAGMSLVIRSFEYAVALVRMVRTIRSQMNIDLVEVPEVLMLPSQWRLPYIMRLHSSAWAIRFLGGEKKYPSDKIEIWLEKISLDRASGISAPSVAIAEFVRQQCKLGRRTIDIIPYAIDTDQFRPAEQPPNANRVLFVGRVEKRKGADIVIEAMPGVWKKHPGCEAVLIGKINTALSDLIKRQPDLIKTIGPVPREHLVTWYHQSTALLVPSIWDNSPNTVIEAMACGTPVIASQVGGIPELIESGKTGRLLSTRDPDSWAEAIVAILDNPLERVRMGHEARAQIVAKCAVDKVVATTLRFYEGVLN